MNAFPCLLGNFHVHIHVEKTTMPQTYPLLCLLRKECASKKGGKKYRVVENDVDIYLQTNGKQMGLTQIGK